MKYKFPNKMDNIISASVDKAIAKMKAKGTLTDNTGKEHTKNFIDFCGIATNDGHDIVVIKETYERVWFTIDGWKTEYPKACKDNQGFYKSIIETLGMMRKAGLI